MHDPFADFIYTIQSLYGLITTFHGSSESFRVVLEEYVEFQSPLMS